MFNSNNGNDQRNSLRRFLLRCAFFFVTLVIAAVPLDSFIANNQRKMPRDELGAWNRIFQGEIEASVVIYGASRALVHYDSNLMHRLLGVKVYNLGIDGHNFWLQYFRHLAYLQNNAKPKLIILDLHTNALSRRTNLFNPNQLNPYMLNNRDVREAIAPYEGYGLLDFYVPMLRYYGKLAQLIQSIKIFFGQNDYHDDRAQGYLAVDQSWNGGWKSIKDATTPSSTVVHPESVELFEKFLKECQALGIKVVLVISPMYFEAQAYTSNRKDLITHFERVGEKYNAGFLDYSNDPISYKEEYFYNPTHLNKQGAERFTAKVSEDLRHLIEPARSRD